MSPQEHLVPIAESRKERLSGARPVGPTPPDEVVDVTVLVRGPRPAVAGRRLTREQYAAAYAARGEDLEAVAEWASRCGLTVLGADAVRRTVRLQGAADVVSRAFAVELAREATDGLSFRARTGSVSVPAELADVVRGVFGLDDRPQATPHFRRDARAQAQAGLLPRDVAAAYRFPRDVDGTGRTIAIVELGGGYRHDDLELYFRAIGVPMPALAAVPVDGGANRPTGSADGPDAEVMLDVEIAGSVAPGARIAVYFAPNTSRGFLDAILAAVHDDARDVSALSISWGAPEPAWTRQSLRAMDDAFRAAALLGITVCAASGDAGSSDGADDGKTHVDFPASSPFVLACGGTRLDVVGGGERAWGGARSHGATGGGVSGFFARPDWQADAQVPMSPDPPHRAGRGVPDVAANADPATGYRVRVDGEDAVIGGTSAVAPLLAALVALLDQKLGRRVGYLNPLLYRAGRGVFRDVTAGTNGAFRAHPGWDACTGLGSPVGDALAALVASSTAETGDLVNVRGQASTTAAGSGRKGKR